MRIHIKHFAIIWSFLFLLFFRPAYYVVGYQLNEYGNYFHYLICIIIILSAFGLTKYGYHINSVGCFIILLFFWCIIGASVCNTFSGNPIDYNDAIFTFSCVLCFVLVCDIGLWYSPKETIFSFIFIGMIFCTINALTMFIYGYSGGMNHLVKEQFGRILSENYFFLGEDNATYFWSWPVLVMTWIYYYKYNSSASMKWVAVFFTIITGGSYFYMQSMLAVVACVAVPITLATLQKRIKRENRNQVTERKGIIRFWHLWITGFAFDILMSTQTVLTFFQPIIENWLKKDMTLSSRTYIWQRSYLAIITSPFFGYGNEPAELSVRKILINHTHNIFLETLYRGGIIGLILFILLFIVLSRCSRSRKKTAIFYFLEIMVFIFLICSSVEFAYYRYHYLIILLLMARPEIMMETQQDTNYDEESLLEN